MFVRKEKNKIFEMKVTNIFNLSDGRTLFSGELFEEVKNIGQCFAKILVDGHCVNTIELEGSWMPGKKGLENPLFRTVSSLENIDKNQLPYKDKKIILVGYNSTLKK